MEPAISMVADMTLGDCLLKLMAGSVLSGECFEKTLRYPRLDDLALRVEGAGSISSERMKFGHGHELHLSADLFLEEIEERGIRIDCAIE